MIGSSFRVIVVAMLPFVVASPPTPVVQAAASTQNSAESSVDRVVLMRRAQESERLGCVEVHEELCLEWATRNFGLCQIAPSGSLEPLWQEGRFWCRDVSINSLFQAVPPACNTRDLVACHGI